MNSLTYRTYNIESIKNEFLKIGFSEEAIDFVFLHNENYNYEILKEKLINVEKNLQKDISNLDIKIDTVEKNLNLKIDNVEKNLNAKIDNVERNLNLKIDNLDSKIDNVEKNLNTKIDNVEKSLNQKLSMGNRLVHFMIITAAILGPILNALFMKYLQGGK
ncbi:Bdr family repetitive protein [Borreliella burgdorferi]|uniref:Bdr family repetitive protein n=1 Tax=Borreliella burgdorferi TaxID=139 RepID=UPI001E398C5D|nr:Bdr family repetitive protein [Borreliella burgdorferi]MCD2383831.1 Bdr family repetitive protein [Borreliella burgdorferi]MCD2384984.1 Bdr family repetitive protein [Borreliella burgdorferi]MCD2389988.1 Bdr family repetitive protein [Borreliella burgdorferi]MCD2393571.1 Bdr family repetitive protein [Borreliella burgdorferi]MCD2394722.1 Bdr family repetitive protein [Borreliella burgdorferi]